MPKPELVEKKTRVSTERFIYLHKKKPIRGKKWVTIHLLVGYNDGTIADFNKMASELRQIAPNAKDEDIRCGKIQVSDLYKSHSIISWIGKIKNIRHDGWIETKNPPDYSW